MTVDFTAKRITAEYYRKSNYEWELKKTIYLKFKLTEYFNYCHEEREKWTKSEYY